MPTTYTWPVAPPTYTATPITVADLIRAALRTIGILAAEEVPSAAEQSDAFNILNDMMDSWAGERLTLFATRRTEHTLTPGLNPHTIGVGGTFNTTRPVRVEHASIIPAGDPSTELPITFLLTDVQWQETQGKETPGRPIRLWVDTAYPLVRLYFNPVPNVADTLVLYTWQQLGRFAATSDTFDFPPGYARAIRSNLAVELASEFGVSVSPELANTASEAKDNVKRLNIRTPLSECDPALIGGGGFNVNTG